MALTVTNYDPVLKDFYEGAIREQLNQDVPLFRILDETDREWSGRHVLFPVHTSRNSGVGARTEGATLPSAGQQDHSLARVSATYHYGRGQISGQTMAAGKNAFAQALAMEMEGLMLDLKVDLGRQTWGTGDGRLAQVGAAGASTSTITVFNRFFEPGQPGARYISAGQLLDAGTVAAPTSLFSSATVVSVNLSQNPATTVDTVTISQSSFSFSQSETFLFNRGAGGTGVESLGIRAMVDEFTAANIWGSNAYFGATLQNISRQTVTQWNATVLGNSGVARVIDGHLIQTSLDRIHTDTGQDANMIMGEHSVVRAFLDAVSNDRRYNTASFDAGMTSLSYNGIPLERDRLAPFNELLVMQKETIRKFTLKELGFADDDGAILSRVANQDNWEFFVSTYFNLGVQGYIKAALMIRDIKVDL